MAGIYHNATLGVISLSSDGSNWITIADKNLGATTVWNNGDTLSEDNAGKYYQWGNNYSFPFTGSITTSTTQVNAQNYGPGNYYSDSTFRSNGGTSRSWDSSGNQNLWGGTTDTNSAKQGPCDSGYHIPSKIEYDNLLSLLTNIGINTTSRGSTFNTYLLMPLSGNRNGNSGLTDSQGTVGFYWSASWSTNAASSRLVFGTNATPNTGTNETTYGETIRPFKNEAVIPDYNDVWDTLYGDELPDRPPQIQKLKWLANNGNYYYFGDAPVHATGISLDKGSIILTEAGQTEQLTATVVPTDAINKKVIWTSSNTNIATVSSTGLVTCVTPGSATITATCVDGGASASCSVDYAITVNLLLIGGGGGGRIGYGSYDGAGGGGGGGQVITCNNISLQGNYSVTIGSGGGGGVNGGNSIVEGQGLCLVANSGKTGTCSSSGGYGGASGSGCSGGNGASCCIYAGGGGGACGAGCNAVKSSKSGDGGLGYLLNINGYVQCYAGGGGGGFGTGATNFMAKGCYGGGDGGYCYGAGCNATTCGSGGGGGAAQYTTGGTPGSGAGGLMIIYYPGGCSYNIGGADCSFLTCGYCIHCFTSSGTLTVS